VTRRVSALRIIAALLGLLAVLSPPAFGTTIVAMSDEDLAFTSDLIVVGTVSAVRSARRPDGGIETYVWKTQGNSSKNASLNMIIRDAIDNPPSPYNNYPTAATNHGKQGGNVGFLDGHVQFVLAGRTWVEVFMSGHYHPSMDGIEYRWLASGPPTWTWKPPPYASAP